MIQQRVGDLLEIHFENRYFYVLVLTKIVMFGGNIVFAFHGDGRKRSAEHLLAHGSGFNVCIDLLMAKKQGSVRRLTRISELDRFWKSRLVKGTNEIRPGVKAREWWIFRVEDLENHIDRTSYMPERYRKAMDDGTFSFDLAAKMMLEGYTPDKNQHL